MRRLPINFLGRVRGLAQTVRAMPRCRAVTVNFAASRVCCKGGPMRVSRMLCFFLLLGILTTLLYAADITGKWTGKSDVGPGWTFNFKSEGNKLTGTMVSAEGKELPIKHAKLDG